MCSQPYLNLTLLPLACTLLPCGNKVLNNKVLQLEMETTTAERGTGAAMETNKSLHFCSNVCRFFVLFSWIPLLFGGRNQKNMWDSNGIGLDPTIGKDFLSWTQ